MPPYYPVDHASGRIPLEIVRKEQQLSPEERLYLLAVEKGDLPTVRHFLEEAAVYFNININCTDSLGRSALLIAIQNENVEIIELLLSHNVQIGDALLHAIDEEVVEAVDLILKHKPTGKKDIRAQILHDQNETADFTPDITPVMLAAHRNNYEILKMLIERGASIPKPHPVKCGCNDCKSSIKHDGLRHSRSRLNIYKALTSPSLIALTCEDPILTAFELSAELRRLARLENEFKADYEALVAQCKTFSEDLLDQTRGSKELEVLLNRDETSPVGYEPLSRLKLAVKYRQKAFVAHPNCQQLLAELWYEGLTGWRRHPVILKAFIIICIALVFPVLSLCYLVAPCSRIGKLARLPFVKFLCHCASDSVFIVLLVLASQSMEVYAQRKDLRGPPPTEIEICIMVYVAGYIWAEIKQLWDKGPNEYMKDWWNLLDFIINSMYIATIGLRITAYIQAQDDTDTVSRDKWHAWEPTLVAEAVFAVANVFSSLRMFYLFTANAQLGPLQISLGRMVEDICKFLCIIVLVLASFAVGLNQLYFFYSEDGDVDGCKGITCKEQNNAYSTLFNAVETLIWTIFGLVDISNTQVAAPHTFTEWIGAVMMSCYCMTSIIVLINMLIAMMNSSFQKIQSKADMEWKFARSRLWMSYFDEGGTLPVPFNIIPTPKTMFYLFQWLKRMCCGQVARLQRSATKSSRKIQTERRSRDIEYQDVMRKLIKRYIANMKREDKADGVSEDDLNEIKQDISSFRYEMLSLLGQRATPAGAAAWPREHSTSPNKRSESNGLPAHLQPGFPGFGNSGRKGKKYQYQSQMQQMKRLKIAPIKEEDYSMPDFLKVKSVKNVVSAVNEFRRQSISSLRSRAGSTKTSPPRNEKFLKSHTSWTTACKDIEDETLYEEEYENEDEVDPRDTGGVASISAKVDATTNPGPSANIIEADIPPWLPSPQGSLDDSQSTSGVASQNASFQSQDSSEEQDDSGVMSLPPPPPLPPSDSLYDQDIATVSDLVQQQDTAHGQTPRDDGNSIPMMKMPAKRSSFLWGGRSSNGDDVTTRYMYNGRMPNTDL
ncbi:short transient receptor potential channel 4-like isoform X2 [Ptychodera flava]|uniref:short transient receptor potential channel 4-like isoform X2 n=1 Tax=Ptychodera flava TaxID=63121 RepID=UPI003969D04D